MPTLRTIYERMPRPSLGFDLLRIYLGVALFVRGALFVSNPARAQALIEQSGDWFMPMLLAHFIGAAHLTGGLLLAIGLATRLAAAVQVPVLVGAVFFVHWRDGLLNPSQSLELAGLVLAMLICYALCGAGAVSVDALLHRRGPATADEHPDLASHSA
jgi:putative oxidoreductase